MKALPTSGVRRSASLLFVFALCLSDMGFAQGVTFSQKPTVSWRFKAGSKFWCSSPVVHGGTVYVGCGDGVLYAVDAAAGKLRWSFKTGSEMMSHYPVCDEKRVFFGSADGHVYAIDMQTGKPAWRARFDRGGTCCSPCLAGGRVVFGGGNVTWTAFNCGTGAVEWTAAVPAKFFAHLASDGKVVAGITPNTVYAADASTGALLWSHPLKETRDCTNPVTLADGKAYYVDPAGDQASCIARDAATGKLLWKFTAPKYVLHTAAGGVAAADGKVYCILNDLFAFDAATGKLLWQSSVTTKGAFSEPISWPMAAGGIVLIGTTDRVVAFDAKTGDRLWDLTTGGMVYSRPTAADGRIYFGCDDANLYCLGYGEAVSGAPKIPVRGPVAVGSRRAEFFAQDGVVHALLPSRNSLSVEHVDFDQKALVHRFSMPNGKLAWICGKNRLCAVEAAGAFSEFDLASGAMIKLIPPTGPDVEKIKIHSRVGDVAVAQIPTRGRPQELVGLDTTTGKQLWKVAVPAGADVLDVVGGAACVYLGPAEPGGKTPPTITALDARSGKLLWKTGLGLPVDMLTTALEYNETLYLGCSPPAWRYTPAFAIDVKSGRIRWQAKIDGNDTFVATADPEAVYVINLSEGRLISLRPTDGSQQWNVSGFTAFLHEAIAPTPADHPLFLPKDHVTVVGIDRATGKVLAEAVFTDKVSRFEPMGQVGCVLSEKEEVWLLEIDKIK